MLTWILIVYLVTGPIVIDNFYTKEDCEAAFIKIGVHPSHEHKCIDLWRNP